MKKLTTNVICTWICCWLAIQPAVSYAQDDTSPPETQVTPVQAGEVVPYNGVLFSTLKAAELTAQLEQSESVCNLRVEREVALVKSNLQLQLDNCTSTRTVYEEMYKTQIQSQQDYIKFLERKASGPRIPQEVVFIVGIVAGVGITIGAGYAMHQASH